MNWIFGCNYFYHDHCLIDIFYTGIELVLGTRVKSADVKRKTLLTASGETITYKILIVATGARVLKVVLEFPVSFFTTLGLNY